MRVSSVRMGTILMLLVTLVATTVRAIIYQCDHFEREHYNVRYCALFNVTIAHFAADVDFLSEYPRPHRIEFFQSNLTEVPRSLFSTFPELLEVNFEESGVEHLPRYTFEHAKQLQRLALAGNELTSIGAFVFGGAERLQSLNVSRNRLKELKEQSLSDVPELSEIDLSYNQLESLPTDVFALLAKLKSLYLHHNRLTQLADGTLRNNLLTTLDLSYNRLREFETGRVMTAEPTEVLRLRANGLQTFTIPLTTHLIDLSANNVSVLLRLTQPEQPCSVQQLNVSLNRLTNLVNVTDLSHLTMLDVSFNPLGDLPLTTFLSLPNLIVLNLEATNQTHLEHGLFSQQQRLVWLDLSFNRLERFELSVLTAATGLRQLYLDGNALTTIDYGQLYELFPLLRHLGLFANHWNCSYLIQLMRYCKRHDISIEPSKPYATVLHLPNVRGIYCQSSPAARLPVFQPIGHTSLDENAVQDQQQQQQQQQTQSSTVPSVGDASDSPLRLLELMQQLNRTTLERIERIDRRATVTVGDPSSLHAYSVHIFILLILSAILIINVGFLLWVQHNANVRQTVDRMIIFRRQQGDSIETQLHTDF
ncbi:insulin-like growth factor-binding protein complex acid labile subunit [Anopheles albimanus]|uniref:insulin-like growth factor-binding protein complex acid labile subunit n=1 Tax=Anopheles albimanus TaxID=7167 RepID=UPI00163EF792|nr:insulin-like growth factor-binding protein complex acid labile subunit [Anopheles albimanus]